jgi:hypothetical protein
MMSEHTKGMLAVHKTQTNVELRGGQLPPIVNWMGFDDGDRTHAEHVANAERLCLCWNVHNDLLAACEAMLAVQVASGSVVPRGFKAAQRKARLALSKVR